MKKLMILSITLLSTLQVMAQSVTWTRDDITYVYSNCPNQLFLDFEGVDADELELLVSDGEIVVKGDNYAWKPSTPGKMGTLTVKANGKILDEFEFKIVRFSDPTIAFMPTKERGAKGFQGITAKDASDGYNLPIHIQSYNIQITDKGSTTVLVNKGAKIETRNKKKLRYATENAVLKITNVVVRCPGDSVGRTLYSDDLEIK